jgi:hypothetical protein
MVRLYEGNKGMINFFIENKFIATLPLNEINTYESYIKQSDKIIVEGLQSGYNLSKIKNKLWTAIHMMKYNELSLQDSQFVGMAILGLIKLKQIDPDANDEGILITGRYRRRRHPTERISKNPVVQK